MIPTPKEELDRLRLEASVMKMKLEHATHFEGNHMFLDDGNVRLCEQYADCMAKANELAAMLSPGYHLWRLK